MGEMTHQAKIDRRGAAAAKVVRVLVVDDSVVARTVISRMVDAIPGFMVANAVNNAARAIDFLRRERVDIILLDIEMPGTDGLSALPDMLLIGAGARILVVSSICEEGAASTIQALSLGAADTLEKPMAGALAGRFAATLHEKLTRLVAPAGDIQQPTLAHERPVTPVPVGARPFDIVAIGASTGGIHALTQLLRELPAGLQTPILITQHLPDSFMSYFAAQIAVLAARPCDVATERLLIRPGRVIVAPGNAHMECVQVAGGIGVTLTHERQSSGCMPSVDPMFASVARVYGDRALGIVLSGMGRDGVRGAEQLAATGANVVAQDERSSVVWGMPGAVVAAGVARTILPPSEIGRLVARGRATA